jgi:hypothetical protein
VTKSSPIVRLKDKRLKILRSPRPLWIIVQRAWWRGGGDKWVPIENTLTHARGSSWAKWEANLKNATPEWKRKSRRDSKAIKVQIEHFRVPTEHQDIVWWRRR